MIGRFIALLMIIIPLGLAAFGVKMSRDALFDIVNPPFPWLWLQLVTGIICIIVGIGFIGGWIVYRDRKRNYNYKTLRQKQKRG